MPMIKLKSVETSDTYIELVVCEHSNGVYFRIWIHNDTLKCNCEGLILDTLDEAYKEFKKQCIKWDVTQ